jgi:P4 family phage/plasmid primase-like protien
MSVASRLIYFLKSKQTDAHATHTGMCRPLMGAWLLDREDENTFWNLYTDVYTTFDKNGQFMQLGITEVHEEYGPVLVDLDMKTPLSRGVKRKYTMMDIQCITNKYIDVIREYVNVDPVAHIFEKKNPRIQSKSCEEDIIKDGVHIMFMNVVVNKRIHKEIHEHVMDWLMCNSHRFEHIVDNPGKDLVDTAIVGGNWLVRGCSKDTDTSPYRCTWKMDANACEPITETMFSIRGFSESDCKWTEYAKKRLENCIENSNVKQIPQEPTYITSEQVDLLLSLLHTDRCDDEPSWVRVGWCLHNIDRSYLKNWIAWSRKSQKFEEGICEKKWANFKPEGFTMRSLCYWAKKDNPELFEKHIGDIVKYRLEYSINCGAHYDIAQVLYAKYEHCFCCANLKRSEEWFQFRDHRWHEIPGGYVLMNLMSQELAPAFHEMGKAYKKAMLSMDSKVVKENKERMDKCMRLAYQVKDNGFKVGVLKECSRMFFDHQFERKRDANCDLIGFENGVFDIKTMTFRDGQPDDYLTKSTEINYVEYNPSDSKIQEIYSFLRKIQPDPDMLEYLLTIMASFLGGSTEEQTFQIWTGSGSNGKSCCLELFERTFGEQYTGKFPVTLLTRERASSGAATPELHDVMRKRFASMQEPNDHDVIYTGAMKEYTGGDKIYSRGLYATPSSFKPQFKLALLCNKMPSIKGWDHGTWRRIRVLNFNSSFVDVPNENNTNEYTKDRKLNTKFEDWKEPFMWILIQKLHTYKKQGVYEPDAVLKASKDYKKKSDSFSQFIDDAFIITDDEQDKLAVSEMYESFRMWWRSAMTSQLPTKNDLTDYIAANTKIKRLNRTQYAKLKPKQIEDHYTE